MAHMIFISGSGTNQSQAELIADELAFHYEQQVIAVAFSEAQRDLAYVAQVARDSIVITHSAGLLMCEDMTPKEVIAIAPPVPESMLIMTGRVLTKTHELIKSGRISDERAQKIQRLHARAFSELALRPRLNVGQARKICRFDTAQLAVKMINRGARVTLGFMDHDLLYPKSARHVHIDTAKRYGAEVHEGLEGHHDEFLLYPLKILEQLNRL